MGIKKLAVIGAGPKAMAIASKNKVLAELGFDVPELHIIEKREVGANWTGAFGYTNGKLELGTSPEKDVGFPYRTTDWDLATNQKIDARMRDFSWQSHLIDEGKFSEWVDRGRPAPLHREWAAYLQWVWQRNCTRTQCHRGEVRELTLVGDRWGVNFVNATGESGTLVCDGIVVTGPGEVRLEKHLPAHDRILTVESFWKQATVFENAPDLRVALVGSGENAASIAMALSTMAAPPRVEVISPNGMTFSRGESFRENRVYSDAAMAHWNELSIDDRRNFIHRTDRGVFSQFAQRVLDHATNLDVVPGRLQTVRANATGTLVAVREYAGKNFEGSYDYVIVATGSDQISFLRNLFSPDCEREVCHRAELTGFQHAALEPKIDESLALRGMAPYLHLPMLSGIAQGPGFANLSCLGRLSDRILKLYVS